MIDLVDVSKSYGPGLPAVNHANLHVDKGEFVFVVGSSGSGKSTLIKLLMKELDSTNGTITVSGERLEKMKHRRVAKYRRKLGVVFQDFRLLKDRNVYENVAFAQQVVEVPYRYIKRQVENMLEMVGLKDRMNAFPNELSGGEQQMLAIGRAIMSKPKIMLMDEPSMGLSPLLVKEIFEIIKQLNQEGMTILLVEQNAKMALSIAHRAYVLETGNIVLQGKASDMLENDNVRKAYLGA